MDLLNQLLLVATGAFVAFVAQRAIFSEKLQEVMYKERLAAAKELTEALGKLQVEVYTRAQNEVKGDKGINKAMQFILLVHSKRLFISIEAFELFKNISTCLNTVENHPTKEVVVKELAAINAYEAKLFPMLRKEFGVEPLTERTKNYFETRLAKIYNRFKSVPKEEPVENTVKHPDVKT